MQRRGGDLQDRSTCRWCFGTNSVLEQVLFSEDVCDEIQVLACELWACLKMMWEVCGETVGVFAEEL